MKAKVTGRSAWQGTPISGSLDVQVAARYVDSEGNASVSRYTGVLNAGKTGWANSLNPTEDLWLVVQGPDDPRGVRATFRETLVYADRTVTTEFSRVLRSSDLTGLIFDYAEPIFEAEDLDFGDAPLTMRAAQQVIEEGGAVVSEWSDIKVDIAQAQATNNTQQAANNSQIAAAIASTFQSLAITYTPGLLGYQRPTYTFTGPIPPAAPNNLTATATLTGTQLKWARQQTDAAAHAVYRRAFGATGWTTLTTALSGTATTYTDPSGDVLYEYAVTAINATGLYSNLSNIALRSAPVYEFRLLEGAGSTIADTSGTYTGAIGAATTWTASGLRFPGTPANGTVGVNLGDVFDTGSAGLYVMMLMTGAGSAAASATGALLSKWAGSGSTQSSYGLFVPNNGQANGGQYWPNIAYATAKVTSASSAAFTVLDLNPHIVELEITPGQMRAWMDNNLQTVAIPGALNSDVSTALWLGNGAPGNLPLNGTISAFAVSPLTASGGGVSLAQRQSIARSLTQNAGHGVTWPGGWY